LAGEMGLASPRLRGREPGERQPELLLEREMVVEPRLVVRGQGEDQSALWPQLDVDAGYLLQLGSECRPARLALAPERDQRLLARPRPGEGRERAGGGRARAGPGRAAVEHRDRGAPRRQPPGDAEPDHACADDGDVGLLGML